MSLPVLIKAVFAVVAAALYVFAGVVMIRGALTTSGYSPGEGVEYVITIFGAAITAFVAAQLGVAIGASDATNPGIVAGLDARTANSGRPTAAVLLIDVAALVVIGGLFVWLYLMPDQIAVAENAKKLSAAPDYISLQAKAFIALVIAGAGGVGLATVK